MPSFLSDDNSPIFNDADVLNLDPNNQFGLAVDNKRAIANGVAFDHDDARSGLINETFDETSTLSTHDSDISETIPMPANGNGTRPTSMSSIANGRSVPDADAQDTHWPKALPNGTTVLPDRTVLRNSSFDVNGHESSQTSQANLRRKAAPSSSSVPEQQLLMDNAQLAFKRDGEDPALHASTAHPEIDPRSAEAQTAHFAHASQIPGHGQSRGSPHRFSSPPTYQPTNANSLSTSPSGHLQPPGGGPTLKQRHTLEIPKPPPGRQSKDGLDTALASGRFSPSVAGSTGNRRASLNLVRRTTRSMQSDFPRDEIVPDEDAVRWAEAYRQKRASKRKRKEEEDDDRVLVGIKVDESHANWVTAYNMLTGIRVSVSRTNAKLDRELTDADFEAKQKSTFDMYVSYHEADWPILR